MNNRIPAGTVFKVSAGTIVTGYRSLSRYPDEGVIVVELTFRPDYALFTIRDVDCDAGVGSSDAINAAKQHIAASTDYEIYICCAQDRLAVSVRVMVEGDAPPANFHGPLRLPLTCPTGEVRVGGLTGDAITVDLPHGPGIYGVDVYHCGRDAAAAIVKRLSRELAGMDVEARLQRLVQHDGVEQYLVRLAQTAPLPDDEDEDEDENGLDV